MRTDSRINFDASLKENETQGNAVIDKVNNEEGSTQW